MYNRVRTGGPVVYDYEAHFHDGTQRALSVAVPALGRKALFMLSDKADRLAEPDEEYRRLIYAVAKFYETRNPGSRIQKISVFARKIPLDGSPAQRRFRWEIAL
jgi:hypothetical protein